MINEPVLGSASQPLPEIPGYRLEAVLGRGSTGTVYRAVQLAVDRLVALKVLHPELAGSKAVRRLQREARTTARLAHPGIVTAIDMGQVGGLWWYAMELIDGPALSTLLREKGKLREREALKLFIPLCEALEHAHEHGVVHRDIKPANILVDAHGRARLVDLGLAFAEDDPLLTKTGGTLGTPHYLSPEQARNPQSVDVRSDIWSLGASMYHAMCGRPPFAGESVAEILSGVLYAHIADPRDVEASISPGMSLVLRKCLTRNPDKRYRTPSELLRDLEALRERRAVAVSARGLDPVAGEKERRRRNLWIEAGAVLVLAAAGVVWWRPWAAPAPTDGKPIASEASWPWLDAVLAAAQSNDRRAVGTALAELDSMGDNVPLEFSRAFWDARASFKSRFDRAVGEERHRIVQEYESALMERDFQRAAALVSLEAEKRVAEKFGVNEKQRGGVLEKLDFAGMRQQVAVDEKLALDRFLEAINAHYDAVVFPQVRTAQASGRWREARALIQRDVREVLQSAGLTGRGLSPEKVEEQIASVHVLKVESEVRRIENDWRAKDVELARAIQADQAALEDQLRRRELDGDAADAIDAAFERELASSRVLPEQMLDDVQQLARKALEDARKDMQQLQEELLVEDARAELAVVDAQLAPLWKDRRYSEIAASLKKRLTEDWLRPVMPELELRIQEALLLEQMLERAAQGLRAPGLDGILVGSIMRNGTIETGPDPLRDGFKLVIAGKSEAYALRAPAKDLKARLLLPGGVERLAGLDDPKDDAQGFDRLLRALFRMREGDTDAALKVFSSGPLPRAGHGALVGDLETRLSKVHGELSARVQERELDAQQAFNLIQRERQYTRDVQERINRINDLLLNYSETEFVGKHEVELRELKAQIEQAGKLSFEARLRAAYGSAISFPGNDRALLKFVCSDEELPQWKMGDWKRSSQGWSAEGKHSMAELEDETLWPRLLLEKPLDLNQAMSVEIEFECPESSGPPPRFIASVAGVHIGFAGPPEVGLKSQYATQAGGVSAFHELLEQLQQRKGTEVAGLQRGERYKLRIELLQGRGRVTASLNGQALPEKDLLRPDGKGGSYSIVVRSLEPVLLKSVTIDAGMQR